MIRRLSKLRTMGLGLLIAITSIGLALGDSPAQATVPYVNTRVNLDSSGTQANSSSNVYTSLSKDGRYVAFNSAATNLVSGDTNAVNDIFVKDKTTGSISRVSVATGGTQANSSTDFAKISYTGRYVVMVTNASNLVASDNNGRTDVVLHDRDNGTTELISVSTSGGVANHHSGSYGIDVSRDGRFVAFSSQASNLVSGDTNGVEDVFVRDRKLGTTTRLSVSASGTEANSYSQNVSISCDGALVAFHSAASNLVASDTNAKTDTFIVDRIGGHTVTNITISGNDSSSATYAPAVSCDGSTIAFTSGASNLVTGDTNATYDIFAYNIDVNTIELISKSTGGTQGSGENDPIGISGDGRYVTYTSNSSSLVSGDTNAKADIFLRDRVGSTTERVSMRDSSTQTTAHSYFSNMSPDGSYISYVSADTGLVSGDTNARDDVFVSQSGGVTCSL